MSHKLQPVNVTYFGPLKGYLTRKLSLRFFEISTSISQKDWPKCYRAA